jgi:sugar phosphate isomerase/epimerase
MKDSLAICIGNQTAFAAATILEPFHYALANGFDAFEWFPDKRHGGQGWDGTDLDAALRAEIRRAAQAKGVRLSVHAHWSANPLSPDASAVLSRDLEFAEALGAALVNVHLYTEMGIPSYARAVLPLLQQAADMGLQLSIENTPETTPQHFNELFAELQTMDVPGSPRAGMCFDLGHANLCPATHNDYLSYLEQLAPHVPIIHLHAHENWGDADTHLPLFTGPAAADGRGIDEFVKRIWRRRYTGSLILEQWPQPPSLLNAARDRLVELLHALGPPPEALDPDGSSVPLSGVAVGQLDTAPERRIHPPAPRAACPPAG